MRKRFRVFAARTTICGACFYTTVASAHGIVGDRFFPPTVTTDDPFAADELSLPTVSIFKNPGTPGNWELDSGFEFDKLIFPHFSLGISDTAVNQKPDGQPGIGGWSNATLIAKYQLWENIPHEAVVSVGLKTDLGGTGTSNLGVDRFNTYTPTIYFGKGFGDLPDSLDDLKPFAITGTLGQSIPARGDAIKTVQWGVAIEYSLPYLQQHVRDVGLPAPFKDMIPLVEISMQTPENLGPFGPATGTINPGVLWEASKQFQLGAEALIPANGRTGPHVGAVVQMQIYIDDLLPTIFGHPIFGE